MTDAGDPLGKPLARIEDRPLVTGRGRYAADIDFPGQLHMRIVRSPHAHAEIGGVDAAAALALEGVRAVWSAADVADIPPIDFRADRRVESLRPYRQHILARDRVRYVGEPVAAVFAETAYLAEDAAELVELDLDPLPAVVAADAGEGEFAPGLGTEAALLTHTYGDAAAGFARATRWSRSTSRPGGIRGCRWRPGGRSGSTTKRATFSRSTARPRCRTATRRP